ncbi:MAG: hypothetical protein ACOX2I_10075 [Candidatus Ozemobacteraceae bacterium]
MGFFDMFDKLDDIIYKPIEAITDWAKEPLKRWEHKRDLEKQTALINAESENRIKENEASVDLAIKQETEIKRILVEIDEYKKDKEFERMKAVSEAIMKYQQELTKLNVNAINAIGHMQLDLREKAQALVYDKTIKYKELQDSAFGEAAEDLKRIENDFSDNEIAKEILIKAVDKRLANIIDTAHNFLLELNADIKLLNQNISILADKGQIFIEQHLDKFHMIEETAKEIKRIEGK